MKQVIFVTGTDTGVGKTVLTALLTRCFKAQSIRVAALKPLCSGGRDDAEALHALQREELSLDEINPWHFKAPVSPLIAARQSGRTVTLSEVVTRVRQVQKDFSVVLVEGAGGLLSPMGEDFDSRELIRALRAIPVVVCANRLGAVNQVRLLLEALPPGKADRCPIVLMVPEIPDPSTRTNISLLADFVAPDRIHSLPRCDWQNGRLNRNTMTVLNRLCRALLT